MMNGGRGNKNKKKTEEWKIGNESRTVVVFPCVSSWPCRRLRRRRRFFGRQRIAPEPFWPTRPEGTRKKKLRVRALLTRCRNLIRNARGKICGFRFLRIVIDASRTLQYIRLYNYYYITVMQVCGDNHWKRDSRELAVTEKPKGRGWRRHHFMLLRFPKKKKNFVFGLRIRLGKIYQKRFE